MLLPLGHDQVVESSGHPNDRHRACGARRDLEAGADSRSRPAAPSGATGPGARRVRGCPADDFLHAHHERGPRAVAIVLDGTPPPPPLTRSSRSCASRPAGHRPRPRRASTPIERRQARVGAASSRSTPLAVVLLHTSTTRSTRRCRWFSAAGTERMDEIERPTTSAQVARPRGSRLHSVLDGIDDEGFRMVSYTPYRGSCAADPSQFRRKYEQAARVRWSRPGGAASPRRHDNGPPRVQPRRAYRSSRRRQRPL